jgi:hypothetical protein
VLKIKCYLLLPAALLAVLLSSCAHTKIIATWKDPQYQGHPQKILVHVMAQSPTVRIMAENQLAEQFEKHGMAALVSHNFLPDDLVIHREAIKKLVQEKGIDTIFIAGPTNRKDLQTLRPGEVSYAVAVYGETDEGFSMAAAGFVYTPGTYAEQNVTAEMVLYDVGEKKRIWSALSKTYVWNTRAEEVKPVVQKIIKMLVDEKIIP